MSKQSTNLPRDKRLMERNWGKGLIKAKEVESYLKSLPDETANAQWVTLDMHDAEIGDSQPNGSDEAT